MPRNGLYAGYVEAPKWGVHVRQGHHEGLIDFETYQQIQDVLEGKKRRPAARADINEDFPLRGFVACDCCGNAMTGAWSKGKYRHYAYYRCQTRTCENKGKSVPVAKMDEGFANILKGTLPAKELFELAKAMLRDAWNMRLALALGEKEALQKQLADIDGQLEGMLDRIVEANSASVVRAYESRIEKLERDKLVLQEKINKSVPPKGRLEDCIELSLKFLSSPWNIWKNGDFAVRQTVLRLAFAEPLRCSQNGVYETQNLSFPFRIYLSLSGI
ncbi:resolvase-like protein [Citreicella sp. 357]|nr:resolvase-like protein [Citreicella sp. 357]